MRRSSARAFHRPRGRRCRLWGLLRFGFVQRRRSGGERLADERCARGDSVPATKRSDRNSARGGRRVGARASSPVVGVSPRWRSTRRRHRRTKRKGWWPSKRPFFISPIVLTTLSSKREDGFANKDDFFPRVGVKSLRSLSLGGMDCTRERKRALRSSANPMSAAPLGG